MTPEEAIEASDFVRFYSAEQFLAYLRDCQEHDESPVSDRQ